MTYIKRSDSSHDVTRKRQLLRLKVNGDVVINSIGTYIYKSNTLNNGVKMADDRQICMPIGPIMQFNHCTEQCNAVTSRYYFLHLPIIVGSIM